MIRITESTLHNIIAETIKKILKEEDTEYLNYTISAAKSKTLSNGITLWPYWINFSVDKQTILLAASKLAGEKYLSIKTDKGIISVLINYPRKLVDNNGNINKESKDALRLENVYNIIESTSKVPIQDFHSIVLDIYRDSKDRATKEAQQIANKAEDDIWDDLCERLGDDTVQEMMDRLRISFANSSIIGHQLSFMNKLKALGQADRYGKKITFLATDRDWRKKYNRNVNFNATPYYLLVPNTERATKNDIEQYAKEHGINQKISDLSQQQIKGISIAANTNTPAGFSWGRFYDVADTTVISNKDDNWNNSIGYKDNLNGIPNDYTDTKLTSSNPDDENALGKLLYGNTEYSDAKKCCLATIEVAKEMGTQTNVPQNDNDAAYQRAMYLTLKPLISKLIASKMRVLKPENQEPLIDLASTMIMMACHMRPKAGFFKKTNFNPEEKQGLKVVVSSLCRQIISKMNGIKEAVENDFEALNNFDEWFEKAYNYLVR